MTEFYIREKDYARVSCDGSIIEPCIITAAEYNRALQGNSYLNPDDFEFFGEYDSIGNCLQAYYNMMGESLLCHQFDC